jgi:hypothetical protein
MLIDIVVAAMPHLPTLAREPSRDFVPVRLKGKSGTRRSWLVRKYMRNMAPNVQVFVGRLLRSTAS